MPGTPGIAFDCMVVSQSPTNIVSASCALVFGSRSAGAAFAAGVWSWVDSGGTTATRAVTRSRVRMVAAGHVQEKQAASQTVRERGPDVPAACQCRQASLKEALVISIRNTRRRRSAHE